jgi:hypothetical protein
VAIVVGSVQVDVVPDVSKFRAKMDAELRDLTVKVTAELDLAKIKAQLEEILKGQEIKVGIDLDDTAAKAKLDELLRRRKVDIEADVDTKGAAAKLDEVGASANGASSSVSGLVAAGISLAPAVIPVAAVAAAAIGAIGVAALGATAGLGSLFLGLSGIGAAVTALQTQSNKSGIDAGLAAVQQANQASAIANAQVSVRNAIQAVTTARANGTLAVQNAVLADENAEDALAASQRASRQAQLDLTQARVDAAQKLQDLANQVAGGELAERQAAIDLARAQQAVALLPKNAIGINADQVRLTYDQAQQRIKDLAVQQGRLEATTLKANKAGVDGATNVVAAQQRVADTQQAVLDAKAAEVRADAAVVRAREQATESVLRAQETVASSQRALAAAYAKTGTAGVASANAVAVAFGEIGPAGIKFAKFLSALIDGPIHDLKASAEAALLPGLQKGIEALLPLLPTFNKILTVAGKALGDLFASAGKALASPAFKGFFELIARTAGPSITAFGKILGDLFTGFAGLAVAFEPLTKPFLKFLTDLADGFAKFGAGAAGKDSPFQTFLGYVKDNAPAVRDLIGGIIGAFDNLVVALAPLGGVMVKVLGAFAQFLAKLTPAELLGIVAGISGIVLALTQSPASGIVFLTAAAAAIVYLYEHSKPLQAFVRDKLIPALVAIGEFVRDKVIPVLQQFGGYLRDVVFPILKTIAQDALDGFRQGLKYVTDALQGTGVKSGEVSDALKTLGGWLKTAVEYIVTNVLPIVGTYLKATFVALGIAIAGVIDFVSTLVSGFKDFGQIVVQVLAAVVPQILQYLQTILDGADKAFSWVPGLGGQLDKAKAAFEGFSAGVNASLAKITDKNVSVGVNLGAPGAVTVAKGAFAGKALPGNADGGHIRGPGGPRDDVIPAMLSNGEYVVKASAVSHYGVDTLHAINAQRFAGGGPVGLNVQTKVPGAASVNDTLLHGIGAYVAANLKDLLVQNVPVSTGGSVNRWAGLVDQALQLLGQPLSLAAGVLRRINFESGGNPAAINLTDINAQNGHPSQGLMQTIPSTFAAYAGGFASRGIDDPFANIYAGLSYALARYGSINAIDPLVRPMGYDAGGYLPPGLTLVQNDTGKPEPVFTADQFAALKAGGSGGAGLTINGNVGWDPNEVVARLNTYDRDARSLARLQGV